MVRWVAPRRGAYDFRDGDAFVAFGERHGLFIVGHTLVWHNQTPAWVFTGADGQPMTATMTTSSGSIKSHARVVIQVPDIRGASLPSSGQK